MGSVFFRMMSARVPLEVMGDGLHLAIMSTAYPAASAEESKSGSGDAAGPRSLTARKALQTDSLTGPPRARYPRG